jgi:hypothetical protein
MDDGYYRLRQFFGPTSGRYRVQATDTGVIVLLPAVAKHTHLIQKLHIEVTTLAASELWSFQDGAGVPIVPNVSAASIAHFDFDFGPDGVPCTEGTAFNLNVSGATGAVGWVTWDSFKKLTLGGAA